MYKIFKILYFIWKNDVSILKTIFLNFHYFTFSNAIKFPVIIYRSVRLKKTKGQIIIDAQKIKPGMVNIGKEMYGFQWKHDYTIWEQTGGSVIFEDGVGLGKGTFIHVGENAVLRLGENVNLGGDDRIICMESITIKSNTMIAWDVQIIDTDFKATLNTILNTRNSQKKAIIIGKNNWLCFGSTILKGSITPDFCIVGAKTLINRDFHDSGENIVLAAGNNAKVVVQNIRYDYSCETKE